MCIFNILLIYAYYANGIISSFSKSNYFKYLNRGVSMKHKKITILSLTICFLMIFSSCSLKHKMFKSKEEIEKEEVLELLKDELNKMDNKIVVNDKTFNLNFDDLHINDIFITLNKSTRYEGYLSSVMTIKNDASFKADVKFPDIKFNVIDNKIKLIYKDKDTYYKSMVQDTVFSYLIYLQYKASGEVTNFSAVTTGYKDNYFYAHSDTNNKYYKVLYGEPSVIGEPLKFNVEEISKEEYDKYKEIDVN